MSMSDLNSQFDFSLSGETLGKLFMPRASTFEVLSASVVQESFVIDSVRVESPTGQCRLTFSEWEEDAKDNGKVWVSEFGIELALENHIAYGTYSTSFSPEQRDAGVLLERLRRDAEEDFMLCAKLIGRSVRRDLVIDEDTPDQSKPGGKLH